MSVHDRNADKNNKNSWMQCDRITHATPKWPQRVDKCEKKNLYWHWINSVERVGHLLSMAAERNGRRHWNEHVLLNHSPFELKQQWQTIEDAGFFFWWIRVAGCDLNARKWHSIDAEGVEGRKNLDSMISAI